MVGETSGLMNGPIEMGKRIALGFSLRGSVDLSPGSAFPVAVAAQEILMPYTSSP